MMHRGEPAHQVIASGNRQQNASADVFYPGTGTNQRRDGKIYPGREPIGGGTGRYTRGGNQSEEGREDMPGATQPKFRRSAGESSVFVGIRARSCARACIRVASRA
eukprot:1196153-Prorocentrum_minimum.AAC.3